MEGSLCEEDVTPLEEDISVAPLALDEGVGPRGVGFAVERSAKFIVPNTISAILHSTPVPRSMIENKNFCISP
jgi:hypothetical protein